MQKEVHAIGRGKTLKEFILGAQDGIVNVLGLILGVAIATNEVKIVLVAGISALFAESISMGAVAYTSSKAARDFYRKELKTEKREVEEVPKEEEKEIWDIYHKKGFRGKLLSDIVKKIISDKKLWVETMMKEELRLFPDEYDKPIKSGFFVLGATVAGSLIPLIPFFFLSVKWGMMGALALSLIVLFAVGAVKSKLTIGDWKKAGLEMAVIGMVTAVAGFIVGKLLEIWLL
ncbi:VIT1/CCC1 transporter family protein [Candidatus Woesearchaeota archaeon]|nr:VIT1/CCC1 transporter family protein [Candidatus Woesearchaeota archaeon]